MYVESTNKKTRQPLEATGSGNKGTVIPLLRISILNALCFLALAGSADAVVLVNPDGSRAEPYQTWADRAKVPTPDVTITISDDVSLCRATQVVDGCAPHGLIVVRQRCETYRSLALRRDCRFVFWHELGHQESREMPQWKRDAYSQLMGAGWTDVSIATPGPGSYLDEAFASAFALCQFGRTSVYTREVISGTDNQQIHACRMIRQPD